MIARRFKVRWMAMMGVMIVVVAVLACTRYAVHRLSGERTGKLQKERPPVQGLGPSELRLEAPAPNTRRLLLDDRALSQLRDSAKRRTEAFRNLSARTDEALRAAVESGYQGFEWADAVAGLSLMWHATGDVQYADAAIRYLRALLDDRYQVGDGRGGKDVVTHDSGYGIRTFGAYTAIGYDWLRDAPGMDSALRGRILERLGQWIDWYSSKGYLRDHAISNYYWGYLTTLSFAGLAASGETPAADAWLRRARDELSTRVLPALREDLKGGGWPEGFQYGEYTTAEIALVARAFRTGAGIDIAGKMPWLSETVTHRVHALLPDERSVYDGGTWGEHPAKPSAVGLLAVTLALEGTDDAKVEEARWMIHNALPPVKREQCWLGLLADRPDGRERPPRQRTTSLHSVGEGLTFMRSDWSKAAVWASFQAGPRLAEDHQDADQGHFELWRGRDGLLVDGGDSEGSATINHNTFLLDDGGRCLNYSPNQGVWGTDVRTKRFGDDGAVVVVSGDIGEAYAPSCAEDGCSKRTVEQLVRTLVYVRPSLLVVHDQVDLDRAEVGVTWTAHTTTAPVVAGSLASAVVGSSRVDIRTLEPAGAEVSALREPTSSGEGSHRANHPWGPMWRIEVPSGRSARERRFLHFITADRADAAPAPSHAIAGDGLHGSIGRVDSRTTAVLFAPTSGKGSATLGGGADLVVIAGLEPGKRYRVAVDASADCTIKLARTNDENAPVAGPGGHLNVTVKQCEVR